MSEASFRHKRVAATISQSGDLGTLTTLRFNDQLIGVLSESEARALGMFLAGTLVKDERKITQETTTLHEECINGVMRVRVDKGDGMTSIEMRGEGDLVLFGNEAQALCDVLTAHLPRDTEGSEGKQHANV